MSRRADWWAALALLGAGCGWFSPREVHIDACGVTITVPAMMRSMDETLPEGEVGAGFGNVFTERYLLVTCSRKSGMERPVSAANMVESALWDIGWAPPGGRPAPLWTGEVDGWPAASRDAWGEDSGLDLRWHALSVDGPEHIVLVTAWALQEDARAAMPDLVDAARTLRIDPPSGPVVGGFAGVPTPPQEGARLPEARRGFSTELTTPFAFGAAHPESPPPELRLVQYDGPVGELDAFVSADPGDGERHPAVLWAHGGFGGIGPWLYEAASAVDDQTLRPFLDRGVVVMAPSWRGENDNPGQFELFYGEVDDLLAARDALAALPYVDPERIYLAGHSTGGTLTLLAAASTDAFRAAYAIGAMPDLVWQHAQTPELYGNTPYDPNDPREHELRSAGRFITSIARPTLLIEGEYSLNAAVNVTAAQAAGDAPVRAVIVPSADHFDVLRPVTERLAAAIAEDRVLQPDAGWADEVRAEVRANRLAAFEADVESWLSVVVALRGGRVAERRDGAVARFGLPRQLLESGLDAAIARVQAVRDRELEGWPERTDVDKLDSALGKLADRGVVAVLAARGSPAGAAG